MRKIVLFPAADSKTAGIDPNFAVDVVKTWKADPQLRAKFHGNFKGYIAHRELKAKAAR